MHKKLITTRPKKNIIKNKDVKGNDKNAYYFKTIITNYGECCIFSFYCY